GWSHGDQEVFSRAELIELFDIKDVASSGAVFDETKLEWLSHEYLKRLPGGELAALAEPFIRAAGLEPPPRARLAAIVETLKERAKTLVELCQVGRFYFERPATYEPKAARCGPGSAGSRARPRSGSRRSAAPRPRPSAGPCAATGWPGPT